MVACRPVPVEVRPTVDLKAEVAAAEKRIRAHVRETPVDASPGIGLTGNARVFFKMENLQITGSFKLRGAMNRLLSLTPRSEEHTSELQSRLHLVCRLLLEKKKNTR